jgi:AcrR family transcriptional regulator
MKDKILQATEQEIRLNGLLFTMDDLAKRIGVSKKTLYKFFASKELLISELILEIKQDIKEQQEKVLVDINKTDIEKMKALVSIVPKKKHIANPMIINQLRKSYPALYNQLIEIYHNDWEQFDLIYHKAVKDGLIESFDLKFFKEVYILSVTNLPAVESLNDLTYEEIIFKTVDTLFHGIQEK